VLVSNDELIVHGEPGIRMGLILLDDQGCGVEFGYMGLDPFGGPRTYSSTAPIIFPFFGGIPLNPQTSYSVHYLSRNHSGEVNLRRELTDRVTVLGGFIFLELNETFDIRSSAGSFSSATDNDLYGFQIGGDLYLAQIRRSVLFSTLKSGVYYNNADVMAEALSGNAIIKFVDDEDDVAFVGDVAVGLLIPMGSHAEFRIGYQGLYLEGVGLAPDQSDNYSLFTASGSLDSSTLLYHGGFVGIDLFW
jgi:hypothetical protein